MRLAALGQPPYKARRPLARLGRNGYVAPSATVYGNSITLAAGCFIDERVTIFQHSGGGPVTAFSQPAGVEMAMAGWETVAAHESYMGLVEFGVGLIPAGGGCKEVLSRYLGDLPATVTFDPNPFVQQAFKGIALASVSTSAEEARELLYLRPQDKLILDPDALIHGAKQLVLGMRAGGYEAPRARSFVLPGPSGRSAIELFLNQMHDGGYATDHDVVVGKKLAYVLTGGNISTNQRVDEQHILDLEREAFLSLCGMEATQARIQHMLSTGKPLRN